MREILQGNTLWELISGAAASVREVHLARILALLHARDQENRCFAEGRDFRGWAALFRPGDDIFLKGLF